jgi:hypothetical protein
VLRTVKLSALLLAGATLLWLSACEPEGLFPDDPVNRRRDTATTFIIQYTNLADNSVGFASSFDPDGSGPEQPTLLNPLRMKPGTEYELELEIRDDTDPLRSVNLTDTVKRRPGAFRICMSSPVNFNYTPTDSDGQFPIGLTYRMKTGSAMNTTMKVSLRDQSGVKNGTCDIGVLMLEVNFPLQISS